MAATATIMPAPWFTGTDINNNPIPSGLLRIYDAGTATPATVWQDAERVATHEFPIVLDGAGRAVVFLDPTKSYKIRLEDAAGVLVKEVDLVASMPLNATAMATLGTAGETVVAGDCCYMSDGSGGLTAGRWYKARANNAYSSTTPTIGFAVANTNAGGETTFVIAGDQPLAGPLTVGGTYYVSSSTAGQIVTTAPQLYPRRVGQAVSALRLVVTANPPVPTVNFNHANNILANQVFS